MPTLPRTASTKWSRHDHSILYDASSNLDRAPLFTLVRSRLSRSLAPDPRRELLYPLNRGLHSFTCTRDFYSYREVVISPISSASLHSQSRVATPSCPTPVLCDNGVRWRTTHDIGLERLEERRVMVERTGCRRYVLSLADDLVIELPSSASSRPPADRRSRLQPFIKSRFN